MVTKQIINLANHCLHLCNSSNIEEIVFPYLIDSDAFVTNNIEEWKKLFDENKIKCPIKKPTDIKPSEKIVVDGSSLGNEFIEWERKFTKQKKAICIYNVDKTESSILTDLVNLHDKMLLSINKLRILSDKHLEKEIDNISSDIIENLVKRELKNIILSLLLSKPMSGTDLVKILYEKFKVFVSPGMLYPTLHELEKRGLLKYEYKLKNKIYSVQEKEQTKLLLKKHVRANSLLSEFLVSE